MSKKKAIMQLMFGTGLSQLVFLIVTPFLTRMYTPQDMGILGAYLSLISISVIFATGRYEMTIVFAENNWFAAGLAAHSIIRSSLIALFLTGSIALLFLLWPASRQVIQNYNIYFVGFGVFALSLYNISVQVILRKNQYKYMSIGRIVHSIVFALISVAGAFIFLPSFIGLVLSDFVARATSVAVILRKAVEGHIGLDQRIAAKQKYARFSKYDQITASLSILSIQAPLILVPFIFDATIAGLYFIVFRVVMSPVGLISNALFDVFKVEATKQVQETGSCRDLIVQAVIRLSLLGLLPVLFLGAFGGIMFELLFGPQWVTAGLYAQILAPSVLFRFVAAPLGFVLQLRQRVGLNSVFYAMFLISTALAMGVGWFFNSPTIMVIAISLSSSLVYCIQILFALYFSGPQQAT